MGAKERTLVKLLVGHESVLFDKPTAEGHKFRWTLFVRPCAPEQSLDRSIINKIAFHLHESYPHHIRVLKEAPFEVSETGYASFSPCISILFNYPGARSIKYTYDMNIVLDKHGYNQQEVTLELKDVPTLFSQHLRRFASLDKKRKRDPDDKDDVTPKKNKPEEEFTGRDYLKELCRQSRLKNKKERLRQELERRENLQKEKDKNEESVPTRDVVKDGRMEVGSLLPASSSLSVHLAPVNIPAAVTPLRPVKMAPNKSEDKKRIPEVEYTSPSSVTSSSSSSSSCSSSESPVRILPVMEMKQRIANLTDENHIFKVASVLLSHRSSVLSPSDGCLSFDLDLTTADTSLIQQLTRALLS